MRHFEEFSNIVNSENPSYCQYVGNTAVYFDCKEVDM